MINQAIIYYSKNSQSLGQTDFFYAHNDFANCNN